MQTRRLIFPIYQEIHRREPGEKAHKQFMGERLCETGEVGRGWEFRRGERKARQPHLRWENSQVQPSQWQPDHLLPLGTRLLLAPGQARPWGPRLRPECLCGSMFTRKTRNARPRHQQGSCCLWSPRAHHSPRGRALCTRKGPKMQRESERATGAPV